MLSNRTDVCSCLIHNLVAPKDEAQRREGNAAGRAPEMLLELCT